MTNAGARRHHAEVAQRILPPLQEFIALVVAFELEVGVDEERGFRAVLVDLHRVIDHEIDRLQRIDTRRITAELYHRVAHRGEINDARHTGEVLQQHASRPERDFLVDGRLDVPVRQRFDIGPLHERAIFAAKQVLEQHAQRERKSGGGASGEGVERAQTEVRIVTVAHRQSGTAAERIGMRHMRKEVLRTNTPWVRARVLDRATHRAAEPPFMRNPVPMRL